MEVSSQKPVDGGILVQVGKGLERAMDKCISQYGGLVWTIARRYVRDHGAAEDVVQETFVDLWKSAKRYDPAIATECTFIGMLARRRALDHLRRQSRQPRTEPLPEAEALPHTTGEPDAAVRCEREDLRRAMATLPAETRELFALHFDQGLTHPEISEKTGLALGTVKTRLRRGLIEVRNSLRRLEGGAANPAER